eukprot:3775343-Rhodomonas_salina.2
MAAPAESGMSWCRWPRLHLAHLPTDPSGADTGCAGPRRLGSESSQHAAHRSEQTGASPSALTSRSCAREASSSIK